MTKTIAALDPGRDKCGFAVLSESAEVLFQKVILTAELEQEIAEQREKFGFNILVIGNGTTSKIAAKRIKDAYSDLTLKVVDEYKTTELARGEYFRANPPKGWKRLLPLTLQTPPVPVDDYVAVILGRRYIGSANNE